MKDLIGTCFCKRRHDNVGYMPDDRKPPLWVCMDCLNATTVDGITIARKVYSLTKKTLDAYERNALVAGAAKAGEYADSIGKTDMADMEESEWLEFWKTGLTGYENAMRDSLESGKAPF